MLVKEYRICMPLSVEEYRIAQLYMIQKKSRQESTGSGSGVEIIDNRPYENGPGGSGQYTFKIYHVGSHLPAWFRAILPRSALRVEEEAWNAYPYTRTRYKCPFVEKFLLEVETVYRNDAGCEDNVFQLEGAERARQVDFIDIVRDPVDAGQYSADEDPRQFVSRRTGRGPLADDWLSDCEAAGRVMCSYKLCRVQFRYWGMQTKIESFIHDVALRKTMLRAHRQAWAWQDEWYGLGIDDIRQLEAETAAALQEKMAEAMQEEIVDSRLPIGDPLPRAELPSADAGSSSSNCDCSLEQQQQQQQQLRQQEEEDDEYFDTFSESASFATCPSSCTLVNSNSLELRRVAIGQSPVQQREQLEQQQQQQQQERQQRSRVLFLVLHGGSLLDSQHEYHNKNADAATLRSTLAKVAERHLPQACGRFSVRVAAAPALVAEPLQHLASVSPYAHRLHAAPADASVATLFDHAPIAAVPLFLVASAQYRHLLAAAAERLNEKFVEFLRSPEGRDFDGRVCLIGDSTGGILGYDLLASGAATADFADRLSVSDDASLSGDSDTDCPPAAPLRLKFSVSDFFLLGCPLALVLSHRRLQQPLQQQCVCGQLYNMYHATDPCSFRLEPLLAEKFRWLAPVQLPKCDAASCGDAQPASVLEALVTWPELLTADCDEAAQTLLRQNSGASCAKLDISQLTSVHDLCRRWWGSRRLDYSLHCPEALLRFPVNAMPLLFHASYWESRDAAAFVLRQLSDAFDCEEAPAGGQSREHSDTEPPAAPQSPRTVERWRRKGSSVRLKSACLPQLTVTAAANHRANDVIVADGQPQVIGARFMYGPLDMLSLSNELVDVHAMAGPPNGEWQHLGSSRTDGHGKLSYRLPDTKRLPLGCHQVKLVARCDHSSADLSLAVVPPGTECVVFSVDGSFAASVSIMGRDPKVRPAAVDAVRHWQDLGYLLLYITARPDLQQRRVVAWLARHNFPFGLVFFMDGLSAEPMRQKAACLRRLVAQSELRLHAAYGSAKDVQAYHGLGLMPQQIFVVGKAARRLAGLATPLPQGYAAHLSELQSGHELSRPARGAGRAIVRRGCFGLPPPAARRPTADEVLVDADGSTHLDAGCVSQSLRGGAAAPRGSSPMMPRVDLAGAESR